MLWVDCSQCSSFLFEFLVMPKWWLIHLCWTGSSQHLEAWTDRSRCQGLPRGRIFSIHHVLGIACIAMQWFWGDGGPTNHPPTSKNDWQVAASCRWRDSRASKPNEFQRSLEEWTIGCPVSLTEWHRRTWIYDFFFPFWSCVFFVTLLFFIDFRRSALAASSLGTKPCGGFHILCLYRYLENSAAH